MAGGAGSHLGINWNSQSTELEGNMNNHRTENQSAKFACLAALALAAFTALVAVAENQSDGAVTGQGTPPCGGSTYYAFAKMTNGMGTFWLTPTGNVSSGTFTNATGGGPSCVLSVTRRDTTQWCSNNTHGLVFPATNATSYSLTAYFTSQTPPLTNGQPINLRVTWH